MCVSERPDRQTDRGDVEVSEKHVQGRIICKVEQGERFI